MGAPIVHFEITGKDAKKLQNFYRSLFDWNIDANNPLNYGIVKSGEKGIGGGIAAAEKGQPGHVTIYAEVDDPDAYLKKVESLGGKVIVPTTVIPNMVTFALFADPEGHIVGIIKEE